MAATSAVADNGAPDLSDVLVDGWGDAAGYHLQLGSVAGWREIAVLRPAGLDAQSWVGYQCVSADGKYVAAAVLPASSVNLDAGRNHGAFAFEVSVASGKVTPLLTGVGYKYFSPSCGTGDVAVFTSDTGVQGTPSARTVLSSVDLASAKVTSSVTVAGQVTSAVATSVGLMGAAGSDVVSVSAAGKLKIAAKATGQVYGLVPADAGSVAFLSTEGGDSASAWSARGGKVSKVGSGPRTRLRLFAGRSGHVTAAGLTSSDKTAVSAAGVKVVDTTKLPAGVSAMSTAGTLAVGDAPSTGGSAPSAGDAVAGSQQSLAVASGHLAAVPQTSAAPSPAASGVSAATTSSGSIAATTAVAAQVPPGVAADAKAEAAALTAATGSLLQPAGSAKGSSSPSPAGRTSSSDSTTSDGTSATAAASSQTPRCAVPRGDVNRQVMQPNPAQVNWASQMAEQNLLKGSTSTRPANWNGYGLAAYSPNTDFPAIALLHPAAVSASTVPRSVYNAIMAQESNYSQASSHAPAGNAGDPLIADYYGAHGDIVSIDYATADCGYGIGQVTDGMHAGDTTLSSAAQVKIAVDYQEDIAAGLQILEGKWNQLYSAGIIANNGDPSKLENWYYSAWAYNAGVQPGGKYNPTGCTPGPTCVGDHNNWGLGWTNNPANADYPPSRGLYLAYTYADAAHPGNWPYQERVMGWMGTPIVKYGAKSYSKPTYASGQDWLQIPSFYTFCTLADDNCDPNATNTSNPGATHCMFDDFECWWHKPVTWISTCATTCATSPYEYGAGSTEPPNPNKNPIACTVDHSKVDTTAIVVDDETSPPRNLQGCTNPNWSQGGTFALTPGTNAAGDPVGVIDTHQVGVGLGGHIWFSHTESGANQALINTGTWTPTLPSLQYYKIKVHFPSIGATATDVIYTINPGGGAAPWKIRVNQRFGADTWATIGTFAMQNGGSVVLTNQSAVTEPADQHDAFDYDVAWDAVAFVPQGGTPGVPIGGPPTVQDEPKGSNPAWLQCGCAKRTAGDPVDTSTGFYSDSFTDLATPGRGMPLSVTRSYAGSIADPNGPNKTLAANGPFGYGWTFNYDMSARTNASSGAVTITQEDHSQVTFALSAGNYTPTAPRFDATLTKTGSTYTFTRSGQAFFTFDATTGRLTAETTRAGVSATPAYWTTMAYNASGQLITVTDPAGRTETFTWSGGHITDVKDSGGREVSYTYSAAADLTDVYGVATTRTPTAASNDRETYGYTAGHEISWMRTPKNYTAGGGAGSGAMSMTYDSGDRVLTQTDPNAGTTTFAYGPSTSPSLQAGQTLVTDSAGHKTLDTYANGLLTTEIKGYNTPDAGTWTYTYDPLSLGISTMSDPDGHTQTFTYDDHGNRTSASNALGYVTSWTYDDQHNLLSTVDATGTETRHTYADPEGPGTYQAVDPTRVLDTRNSNGGNQGVVAGGAAITLQVAGRGGIPTDGASAVAVTMSAIAPQGSGTLRAWANGATEPGVAALNYTTGVGMSTLVIVPLGSDGKIQIRNTGANGTNIAIDVAGYIRAGDPTAAGTYEAVDPTRVLDTRNSNGGNQGVVAGGAAITLQVAGRGGIPTDGASAVAVTMSAIAPQGSGTLRAWANGATEPGVAALNYTTGVGMSTLVIVPLGSDGKIQIRNTGANGTNIAIDVAGYIRAGDPTAAGTYEAVDPTRVLDTRNSNGGNQGVVAGGAAITLQVAGRGGIPTDGASAVAVTMSAIAPQGSGTLRAWANGATEPGVAALNYTTGVGMSTLVIVPLGSDGKIQIRNTGANGTNIAIDVAGYITDQPQSAAPAYQLTSTTVTTAGTDPDTASDNAARTATYSYTDPAHPADLTASTDPLANTTTYTYDAYGDQTSATDPDGNKAQAGYNTIGQLTSAVDPNGTAAGTSPGCVPPKNGCTTYTYNKYGQVLSIIDALGHTASATYDANGNQITTTDGNQHTTTIAYDAGDRPTTSTAADNTATTIHFNPDSTIKDTVNGLGAVSSYSYDGQGRAVTSTDPLGRTTTATIDPAGMLTKLTDPAGRDTTMTRDAAGQLTAVSHSDGTTQGASYTYDADGRRLTMTDGTGTTSDSYNIYGNVISEAASVGASTYYTYDDSGQLTKIKYATWTNPVTRTIDGAGRITAISDLFGKNTTFGYDPNGSLTSTTYPDGVKVTNTFNAASQNTGTTAAPTAGGPALYTLGYSRDNTGQLASQTVNGSAQTFTYSPRQQLSGTSGGVAGSGGTAAFAMDAADQPATVGTLTQTFDAAGQECWSAASPTANPTCNAPPAGATSYTFDGVGQRTASTPSTGAGSTYSYDQVGRLTTAATPAGSGGYTYAGDGTRTSKTVGSTTTVFINSGQQLLQAFTNPASNNFALGTAWIYGPDGLPFEQTDGTTAGTYYYVHDQVGSTRALLTNPPTGTGAIAGTYAYTPYGVATHTGTANTPLQYTGQYLDDETGLLFLHARYYDPSTAQFLTRDPALAMTGTPYAYVRGNPLNDTDTQGLCGFWCWAGIAVGGVAVAVITFGAAIPEEVAGGVAIAGAAVDTAGVEAGIEAGVEAGAEVGGELAAGEEAGAESSVPCVGEDAVAETPPDIATNGETSATAYGRMMHKAYDYGPGFEREVTLQNGLRADAVNFETREVLELKPNNPRAIRTGTRQVQRYVDQLNKESPGTPFSGRVVTYDGP
ncbi:RHS repeat-associated core domain-containing protein [Nakamurella sp. A5-74]|uniref:RHS repeat-associated core domain-containing protein n=1 Tax=Nakamurella sp. A5-74 TaxID=3158264 RepID=A0AAU8DRT3_9ACTN